MHAHNVSSVRMLGQCFAIIGLGAVSCLAQTDPGPRAGAPGAGQPLAALSPGELDFFTNVGTPVFNEVETVATGLGPRFNLDSCGGCHAYPAVGGSSPPVNPQYTRAATMAPGNTLPSFIKQNGPVREARFILNADGSIDGGVHDIFTITGRPDAPHGCAITQPNFAQAQSGYDVIFRIPTPVFGAGLIEAITDSTIQSNLASDPGGRKKAAHITGHVNTNGNDGTVTRFGWKAQNKSLIIFAAEAYNVEMGVTNEGFLSEREEDPNCATNPTPESDFTYNVGSIGASDITAFRGFMRFLDQPAPACTGTGCSASIQDGRAVFSSIGCDLCHTPSLPTGSTNTVALAHQTANLFSDLAVHHMGATLTDGVMQGTAGPDEFRSAPLWGVGQRIFFLHDGRTSDLQAAILAHSSDTNDCAQTAIAEQFVIDPGEIQGYGETDSSACGSEANSVIKSYRALTTTQKQDLLNFLRSL